MLAPQITSNSVPASRTRPIEAVRVGDRVVACNPQASAEDLLAPEPEPAAWRRVELRLDKPGGGGAVAVTLLRPVEWAQQAGAAPGSVVELDPAELGASGPAEVLSVGPRPPVAAGPGRVVTGTFAHHAAGDVADVSAEGLGEPTGATDNHRFWSEDRRDFIPAGELRPGERVRTLGGLAAVRSDTPRPGGGGHRVFNLEVHGEHAYRVSHTGALVHNACSADDLVRMKKAKDVADVPPRFSAVSSHEKKFIAELRKVKESLIIYRTPDGYGYGDFVIIDPTNKDRLVGWVVGLKKPAGTPFAGWQLREAAEAAKFFELTAYRARSGNIEELMAELTVGRASW